MPERIEWDDHAALHIRTRSSRYPDAVDIEPVWTVEVINDPDRIVDEPDPRSAHINSVRIVGYSARAEMIITVVALRDGSGILHGASAWRRTGRAGRRYRKGGAMSDPHRAVDAEALQAYREEAEATRDEPLSADAIRPARGKVLSVRLNPDEFEALSAYAEQLDIPASTLVRSWILNRLRADSDTSAVASVDRIAREVEQLRRRLVS